ncbi:dnaJ/Hsp40 cysteine-rich domain superfamily protein [Tasmannia lanceolata]|uniref:dnaJ/Hsp40 cysteine-rich domain superfamily protein n=1 Tax=Tasmannia lanceolata TaxID=3420 RepID=UPI004063EA6E
MTNSIMLSSISLLTSSFPSSLHEIYGFHSKGRGPIRKKILVTSINGSVPSYNSNQIKSNAVRDVHRVKSNLESLFCYDKPIPEEIIEKPIGLSLGERNIADNPRCIDCQAKGAVLCTTCSGSGLYIDSILESQGIIVKVRCLGCGGTGNIMCSECGGRGHIGIK